MELISDDISETPAGFETLDGSLDPAVLGVLTFLYRCLGDDVFRTAVESTIIRETMRQLRQRQKLANIDVNVSVSVTDERTADGLKGQYDAGENLTDSELIALYYWGRISNAEYYETSSENAPNVVPRE